MSDPFEPYYVGVYWGIREETVETCAARASAMFNHLAECDPIFQRWFMLGRSRKEALKHEVKTDVKTMQALLLKGRNRTDFGRQVIHELGFSFYAWNGGEDDQDAVGINFTCGCYAHQIANHCLIRLPSGEDSRARVMRIPVLIDILKGMVTSWEADWGVVNSSNFTDIAPRKSPKAPIISWITYLSEDRGILPLLPAPVRVEDVDDHGNMIILTEERFTVNNPTHLEIASRVTAILDQTRLLEPLK
ncbi:MAG: hypothetical protein D9V45_05745 [Chloroflexi bacterium]|nr:MAG: hypothetical protein D9V45_05745 [Chloroflexota bacterium]